MSNISQSKYLNRGPLIAVIKIELDAQNVDRIFLHLKDNDEDLAQQFVQKHSLNPMLKKHIYQRIQMSRQAVDKNKKNQKDYDNEEEYNQYEQDSFTTPMPKRQLTYNNESSNKKPEKSSQKPQNYFQRHKYPQPYITYDDNQPQQENNDTFQQRYHGSFEHYNQNRKIYDINMDKRPFHYQDQHMSQEDEQIDYRIKRQKRQKKDQIAQIQPQTNYLKDKYKNLYDVSGLKLKSNYPSVQHDQETSFKKVPDKQYNQEYASSESSQGLFEKELSNEKNQLRDLGKHRDYNLDAFRKQRPGQFISNSERESIKYKHSDPTVYKPAKPLVYDSSSLNPQLQRHTTATVQTKQPLKAQQQIQKNAYNKSPQTVNIQKENQTKFSSIQVQKLSQTDEMDLNYISFNKPIYENSTYDYSKKLPKSFYRGAQTIQIPQQSQTLTQNRGNYLNNHSSKKVGSIRSNAKNYNDSESSFKQSLSHKRQIAHQYNKSDKLYTPYEDLQSPTVKFNQEKSFTNIQDLQDPKNLQQNREINTQQHSENSTRPNVKFYNKEEMKSLKQSTLSKSMSRSQISRINAQVTSRLYNEAQIKKKYLETIKARARNLKQEELIEKQELRDKPEISLMSKLLAQNRIKENKKIQDYLIDQGKILQLKRQQMADRQARKQLQQCSFKPYINEQSQRLSALHRSRSSSRISNHSEIKCSKRTYHNNQQTFHPEINKLSSVIAKDKGNFNQRQHAYLQEKNSNLFKKMQQQRMKEKTDPVSGQRLFKPQLTERTLQIAKQSIQKTRQNKPIHNYLYELSKIKKVQQKIDPKPSINPQSEKLILELQDKRLNWLFLELDNDQDGLISSNRISIDQIPSDILEIISPVLFEMEDLNTPLNLEDFKSAIKNLNKNLDPYQKSLLYNYNYSAKPIRT